MGAVATNGNGAVVAADDGAVAVWADFLRAHANLTDVLAHELVERCGMPLTWFDVLVQLDAAPGGRLRMQELAAAVVLSKSGLTRLVDRVQEAGFVARTTCPSDRRGTFAEITPAGRVALRKARPIHLDGVRRHFADPLSGRDIATLGRAMRALLAAHGLEQPAATCGG